MVGANHFLADIGPEFEWERTEKARRREDWGGRVDVFGERERARDNAIEPVRYGHFRAVKLKERCLNVCE